MPAIHLVRHAAAGDRWPDAEDSARPLTTKGRAQADAVAELLLADHVATGATIGHIVSSPARRCRETVAPLAARLRLPVEVDDAWFEGDEGPAWRRLDALGGHPHDVVVCSHGDIIPALLHRLAAHGVPTSVPPVLCPKASVWTLHVDEGTIRRAVYTPRP